MGLLAFFLTFATLAGPGLTIDEPLDVRPGRDYVVSLWRNGWGFFERTNVDRLFRDNAEHPPLGRWLLGLASLGGQPFETLIRGADPTGLYVVSARLAPAVCFALLVGLVGAEAARRWGRASGFAAAWSLLVMPRVFAHAHLGALDTFLSLFWTLALIAGARAVDARRPTLAMVGAGALWSLALLTKIHAWLLAPLIVGWAFLRLPPLKALRATAAWLATGVGLFVLGWPWLWYDTLDRWAAFWGTSVARATIRVEYFGRIWNDRELPWHYPWLYFAVTVPVVLQGLGALGLWRGWRGRRNDRFPLLLAASILLFLTLFSARVPVYDGERLFLLAFPAWAILIGCGFGVLWRWWGGPPWPPSDDRREGARPTRAATGGRPYARWARAVGIHGGIWSARLTLGGILLGQCWGLVATHPFGLSYYNLLVGGLPGAERLGLELTYWGDAVDRVLLDELARRVEPGSVAALAPTLYPGQGAYTTTGPLVRREVVLQDESEIPRADWVVVSRREAYWSPELRRLLEAADPADRVMVRSRQGVWLSALLRVPAHRKAPRNDPRKPQF